MGKGLITRRGGKSADRTAAPSINFISATTTSLTFTFKNNENTSVDFYYGLTTPPTTKITLAANATSSNITFSALNNTDSFNVYAYAIVIDPTSKKIKSEIIETQAQTLIPTPTITQVSKTAFAITFTVRNNSRLAGDVIFGITNPPTTTVSLNANTTSSNQTISNLDPVTTYTVFAQTQVPGFSDSAIVSSNVTTGTDFIAATGGTITDIGNYRYHSFTSVGTTTFEVSNLGTTDGTVDYLIVGGGNGGSKNNYTGTGGAGGGVIAGSFTVNVSSYTFVVGNGGSGRASGNTIGGVGAVSSGFGFTTGVPQQGLNDSRSGNGINSVGSGNDSNSAGGAGSGAANSGLVGGLGFLSNITGTNYRYGAGGGGGTTSGSRNLGGANGGGSSNNSSSNALAGAPNSGSGGGGGSNLVNKNSANGGSGIVIIRYPFVEVN